MATWEGPQLLLAKVKNDSGRIGIFLYLNLKSQYSGFRFFQLEGILDSNLKLMGFKIQISDYVQGPIIRLSFKEQCQFVISHININKY